VSKSDQEHTTTEPTIVAEEELRIPELCSTPPQMFYVQAEEPHFVLKTVCGPQVVELTQAVSHESGAPQAPDEAVSVTGLARGGKESV